MAGSSIFDYVHPEDHSEFSEYLDMCLVTAPVASSPSPGPDDGSQPSNSRPGTPVEKNYTMVCGPHTKHKKSLSVRMKSTLTKRGMHVKTSGYRVVHILGSLRPMSSLRENPHTTNSLHTSDNDDQESSDPSTQTSAMFGSEPQRSPQNQPMGLVGMAIALPPPTITELRLELDNFIMRLGPDFKITFCEPTISDLIDLQVDDVTGRLLYDLCHPEDLKALQRTHTDILRKGQALTDYYRLLTRSGGYVWVQTCATTLLNNKNNDEHSILAIVYVVSSPVHRSKQIDLWQLTGDATLSMSSATDSDARREKLQELKAVWAARGTSNNTRKPTNKTNKRKKSAASPRNVAEINKQPTHSKNIPAVRQTISPHSNQNSPHAVSVQETSDHSPSESYDLIEGESNVKRRKMDKPRKREQSLEEVITQNKRVEDLTNDNTVSNIPKTKSSDKALNLSRLNDNNNLALNNNKTVAKEPETEEQSFDVFHKGHNSTQVESNTNPLTPEDLSVKGRLVLPNAENKNSATRNIIQHSSYLSQTASESVKLSNPSPPRSEQFNNSLSLEANHQGSRYTSERATSNRSNSVLQPSGDDISSSVHDLEVAMNRHLPGYAPQLPQSSGRYHTNSSLSSIPATATSVNHVFSPSAFPSTTKSSGSIFPDVPVYTPPPPSPFSINWLTPPRVTGGDGLSASNFLRSLYSTNTRETVIKTRSPRCVAELVYNGADNTSGDSRSSAPFINPDMPPSSLLTPPEPNPSVYRLSQSDNTRKDADSNIYHFTETSINSLTHSHDNPGYFTYNKTTNNEHRRDKELSPRQSGTYTHLKEYSQNVAHNYFSIPPNRSAGPDVTYHRHTHTHTSNLSDSAGYYSLPSYSTPIPLPVYNIPCTTPGILSFPPISSPYKEIIPAFSIPSLMSPSTPGPLTSTPDGTGPTTEDDERGDTHKNPFPQLMHQPYAPASSPHHQHIQQQHRTDAAGLTPPASASPDLGKLPPLLAAHTGNYPSPVDLPMSRQPTSPGSFAYHQVDQHYENSLVKGSTYGMVTAPVGAFMDLSSLHQRPSYYETCRRPMLSWY